MPAEHRSITGEQLVKFQSATEKAFCAAFFFLPLSKPLLFISLLVAFSLFVAGGGLAGAGRSLRALPWWIPALILGVLPLLSLVVHADAGQGMSSLNLGYYWLLALVTFLAAARMPILPWIRAFLLGVLIVFIYVQCEFAGQTEALAGPGVRMNYILYSQLLAVAVVLLSVLYRHEHRAKIKAVYLAGIGVFFLGLVSGAGRSGVITVLVLLPFIFGNIFPRHRGKVMLACVIALAITLASPVIQTRIDAAVNDLKLLQQNNTQTSIGHRFEMWRKAWEVFRENPLTGAGPNGFSDAWHKTPRSEHAMTFVEPHSAFLFYASSYGIFGLIALVWLYGALLWTGWKHRAGMEGGVLFGFAVVCITGSLTNTMFLGAVSLAWMMLFIGLQGGILHANPEGEART